MAKEQIYMTISIVAYLLLMIVIGWICMRKNKDAGDFYLGGRKLGPFVTAMSAEASDMSSYLLMGLPGLAYLSGMSEVGWTAIGLALGTYLNWLIVAKRIRNYTEICENSITIPEFLSNRYRDKDKRHILTAVGAIVIIVFFIPYTASGFSACGKLFNSLFGVDYMTAMIVSAVVIIAYTAMGGFLAASTTDFVQGCIMSAALLVILGFGINMAGGFDQVLENSRELAGYFSLTQSHDPTTGEASPYGFISIVSTLAWGLGYFGMPHILLRFMAIEDRQKLKLSRRVATIWVVISMAAAVAIGMVGLSMTKAGEIPLLEGSSESETVIIEISNLLATYGIIPALIAGIVISGILASIMSTADSQLLAASSSVSQNLLQDVAGIKISKKTEMLFARGTLLVIAVIAAFLARNPDSSVFRIVSFAWAGFGGAFGPVILASLFWKRANFYGALAGIVSGGVMVFVWKFLVRPLGGAWDIYELLPAFIISLAAIIIVSRLTPPPSEEIQEEFEKVKAHA